MDLKKISILIPCFNEEQTVGNTLSFLRLKLGPDPEIIVVNDGSSDRTKEILSGLKDVIVINSKINRGYGASLKKAINASTREVVVWFDADGQHHPDDLVALATPVVSGDLDANIGARNSKDAFVLKRAPGKFLLRSVSQIVARRSIPDLNCGFRCFKTKLIKKYLTLLPDGFSASSTSTLLMIRRGYRVDFHPVKSSLRGGGKSRVSIVKDGLRTLRLIGNILLLFDSFLVFTAFSFLMLSTGLVYSFYIAYTLRLGIPVLGATAILIGVLTFFMGLISSQISELRKELLESM